MAKRVWGQADEPEEIEREPVVEPPPAAAAHVHDWTEYPSGKRKCKPCGAIERSEH
jgi:hypothetical protein